MRRPKTYLEIEESRNRRLWFKEVVLPFLVIFTYIFSREGTKEYINKKKGELHETMERIFSKRDR